MLLGCQPSSQVQLQLWLPAFSNLLCVLLVRIGHSCNLQVLVSRKMAVLLLDPQTI
jgi:hypothetical protein